MSDKIQKLVGISLTEDEWKNFNIALIQDGMFKGQFFLKCISEFMTKRNVAPSCSKRKYIKYTS